MRQSSATDTNTQAMTEVALGLSMAFFSLLILALLSISAGNQSKSQSNVTSSTTEKLTSASQEPSIQSDEQLLSMLNKNRLSLTDAKTTEQGSEGGVEAEQSKTTFIFYYKGQYYDTNLAPQSIDMVNPNKPTVVAVAPNLSFSEVMQVHQDFSAKEIQITAMDKNWLSAFAEHIDALAHVGSK